MPAKDRDALTQLTAIFELIQLLSAPPYLTTRELGSRIGVDRRTIERYFKLLGRVGYLVDKDPKTHRYFLHIETGDSDTFDVNEAGYLNDILQQLPENTALKDGILLKLNKQYRLSPMVQTLQRGGDYHKLRLLNQSVEDHKTVILTNYVGGDGKISPSRHVAVTGFSEGKRKIHAIDLELPEGSERTRQFAIARIGQVTVTEIDLPDKLAFHKNDVFDYPGTEWYSVRLKLTRRATQLLSEEFPASRPDITEDGTGGAVADLRVRDWPGVGRFCLGLPDDVEVLDGGKGEKLREYLRKKVRLDW